MNWNNEIESIKKMLLDEKRSYEEVGRIYNCTGAWIKKLLKKYSIEMPYRRRINPSETFNKGTAKKLICLNCGNEFFPYSNAPIKFCSRNCYNEYKKRQFYIFYLENQEQWNNHLNMRWIKPYVLEEQDNKCAICGQSQTWNGKQLVFVLDHIDGHCSNNARNNIRLICPNCDSQLETYKRKNKVSDRAHTRKKRK